MKKQDLQLEFIENGRMSDIEMSETYGGYITCNKYHVCNKNGKSSCHIYEHCTSETSKTYCTNRYWVAGYDDEKYNVDEFTATNYISM